MVPHPKVLDVLFPYNVVEVRGASHYEFGSAAERVFVPGVAALPPGRYRLEVLTFDATGWCTGSSLDPAGGQGQRTIYFNVQ